MLYDRRNRYSFCQSSAFQCPRADITGGFPRAAPHHHCPFSARINQKHLVHDVLEQPTRLSPVSFSISGECSTGTNWGCVGEKEKCKTWLNTSERHSPEKIKPALRQLDYTDTHQNAYTESFPFLSHRASKQSVPFPSVEERVKSFSFSWPLVSVI